MLVRLLTLLILALFLSAIEGLRINQRFRNNAQQYNPSEKERRNQFKELKKKYDTNNDGQITY